jgi:hypothetical protein
MNESNSTDTDEELNKLLKTPEKIAAQKDSSDSKKHSFVRSDGEKIPVEEEESIPSKDSKQLGKIYDLFRSMTHEQKNMLIDKLGIKNSFENNNDFSDLNKKNLTKMRLRQKLKNRESENSNSHEAPLPTMSDNLHDSSMMKFAKLLDIKNNLLGEKSAELVNNSNLMNKFSKIVKMKKQLENKGIDPSKLDANTFIKLIKDLDNTNELCENKEHNNESSKKNKKRIKRQKYKQKLKLSQRKQKIV